jgi:hypothetical protein
LVASYLLYQQLYQNILSIFYVPKCFDMGNFLFTCV